MIATQSPELDEILQGFPAVKQVDPVEDAEFIRFTIQLRIDPADHPNPPQIFVLFRQSEFMQARTVPTMLGSALRNKIAQTSFKDGSNGSEIRTTLRQDRNGTWVALTVDGSMWDFDPQKDRWIKGPVSL
ncbi:MAG: hypothetical protein ABSE57_30430 [Bryobacteraceae bacterium]|jgi:hypothetical protein